MNVGIIIWLLVFALSAAVFFIVAAVVAVKGLGDLRTLLRDSKRNGGPLP
jgi:hypothetical protein